MYYFVSMFVELDELIWQVFNIKLHECLVENVVIFIWIAIAIWI